MLSQEKGSSFSCLAWDFYTAVIKRAVVLSRMDSSGRDDLCMSFSMPHSETGFLLPYGYGAKIVFPLHVETIGDSYFSWSRNLRLH